MGSGAFDTAIKRRHKSSQQPLRSLHPLQPREVGANLQNSPLLERPRARPAIEN